MSIKDINTKSAAIAAWRYYHMLTASYEALSDGKRRRRLGRKIDRLWAAIKNNAYMMGVGLYYYKTA